MELIKLENGLDILFYPVSTAYSVVVSLNIHTGVFNEDEDNNGITHLLEHLHFRSLENMTQDELYRYMDKIGGNLKGETYRELLRFYVQIRPQYLYNALEIFKKMMCTNLWSEKDISMEKEIIINEIREKEDYTDINLMARSILLEDTPFGMPIIGNEDTLKNISAKTIQEYKKKAFSKGNVALVIVGNIKPDSVADITKYFEDIKLVDNFYPVKKYCLNFGNDIKYVNCGLGYASVVMSFNVDSSISKFELNLLNSILGGGIGSILQRIIREKSCLLYDIYSDVEVYSGISLLNIRFFSSYENVEVCLSEVVNILNSIKTKIDEVDMETNLPYYTENLWFMLENMQMLNDSLSWEVFENKCYSVEEKIEIYKKINMCNLVDIANKIFNYDNCELIVFGNENVNKERIYKVVRGWIRENRC